MPPSTCRLPTPALLILLGGLATTAAVQAQPALPDAGSLQRQAEQAGVRACAARRRQRHHRGR